MTMSDVQAMRFSPRAAARRATAMQNANREKERKIHNAKNNAKGGKIPI
jgi:hypothetical protein